RDIPMIVRSFMSESIREFLAAQSMSVDDITHYVAHPGGAKVLAAYEESLGLDNDKLRHTRAVLRECGNMSSCSVLFVLERFVNEMKSRVGSNGTHQAENGILCALGPGFSAELVLLRWD
ncbi:MAG: type III polyketide synthase, partial [bacterium]|nr:type III polyketide synthase [Candidatus Kapabacteria bacterium]